MFLLYYTDQLHHSVLPDTLGTSSGFVISSGITYAVLLTGAQRCRVSGSVRGAQKLSLHQSRICHNEINGIINSTAQARYVTLRRIVNR